MKTKVLVSVLFLFLNGCTGSGSSDEHAGSLEKSTQYGSVEVGSEVPNNGVRPVETICTAGSFVRTSTNSDACGSEQFDVFLDGGYYALRGFADKEYYFFDPGTETYDTPSVINNGLSLVSATVDGQDDSACTFFCSTDNQSIRVLCVAPGEIVCGDTVYSRVADAPVDPVADSSSNGDAAVDTCSQASGTYEFQQVSCNPGLVLYPEQVGELPPLEVQSADDLSGIVSSTDFEQFLPGTVGESHFECSPDGNEVYLIGNASSGGFTISCTYLYTRS